MQGKNFIFSTVLFEVCFYIIDAIFDAEVKNYFVNAKVDAVNIFSC